MLREFAELMLAAIVAWGLYALILALAEDLSEWLTKRVLRKGKLVEQVDDEERIEVLDDNVVEEAEGQVGLNRYSRLRSHYRRNRRQSRCY